MQGITDEKVRAIRALREAGLSQRQTKDVLDTTKDTVSNYDPDGAESDRDVDATWDTISDALGNDINPSNVVEDEYLPENFTEDSGEEFSGDGPQGDPFREQPQDAYRLTDDYASMSPGQFIKEFFEDFEIGAKKTFIKIMSRRADRREQVPKREQMKDDLVRMSSGVSKSNANYVAEEYWEEAKNYLEESEYGSYVEGGTGGEDDDEVASSDGDGGWESVNKSNQQGTWVTMPDGSRMFGRMVDQPDGTQQFQPMQPPGGAQVPPGGMGNQQQPQQNGGNEEMKVLLEEIRELRESQGQQDRSDPMSKIKELREFQRTIEEMSGGNGTQQETGVESQMVQEIRQLRAQMQQDSDPSPSGNPMDQILQRMASREDVDPQKVADLMDRIEGSSDPQVREKEIEKEMKQMDMEAKQQRTEQITSALQEAMERIGQGIGSAVVSGNASNDQQGAAQQQSVQQQTGAGGAAGQPAQQTDLTATDGAGGVSAAAGMMSGSGTETRDCPSCDEESTVDTSMTGFECDHCDFSLMPCPSCNKPVEIPPAGKLERGGCPDCGEDVMEPAEGEIADCLSCGWSGPYEEASGDTVECTSCGHETEVLRGATEA